MEGIPVEKDGVTTIWAPVNCGGTIDLTTVDKYDKTNEADVAITGYYYQWGRKAPLGYGGYSPDDFAPDGTFPTYAEGNAPDYQSGKFIKGSGDDYSWFSDYKNPPGLSPLLTVGDNAWPRDLQPCPTGWRVPVKDELDRVQSDISTPKDGKVIIPDTNGKFILLTTVARNSSDGRIFNSFRQISFWSASLSATGKAYLLYFEGSAMPDWTMPLGTGTPIRCVQE